MSCKRSKEFIEPVSVMRGILARAVGLLEYEVDGYFGHADSCELNESVNDASEGFYGCCTCGYTAAVRALRELGELSKREEAGHAE